MSEFPSEWEVTNLGAYLKETKERVHEGTATPYSVSKVLGIVPQSEKFKKRVASNDISNYKIIRKGDFAYDPMLLWDGSINRMLREDTGAVSPAYVTFRVLDNSLDANYLLHFLKADTAKSFYKSISKGTNVRRQKAEFRDFASGEFAFPPLPEQKKIAEILSGIDKQIMSVKSEIQQARKISTAVTKDLIGTIQDESLPLSEVAVNHDSIRVPIKSEERALRNGPYRYFGASGIIDDIDDFLFDGDYILIGEDGANIIDRNKPLAFKVSGKFWVNNHAHIIQPRESCDINFLTYYLESLDYTGIASGSAQPKITRSALDAIQVPLPPLEVQKKIGSVIESTIGVATTAEKKEKKLIDLKQALSSDLLSGRKRVSV